MKDMKKKNKNENWIAKMDMAERDKQAAEANALQDAQAAKTWKPKTGKAAFAEAEAGVIKSQWFKIRRAATGIRAHQREVDELEQKAILDGMKIGWNAAAAYVQENNKMRKRIADHKLKNKING